MRLDPEVAAFLADHPAEFAPPDATPAERRAAIRVFSDASFDTYGEQADDVHAVNEVAIPVDGGTIRARVYHPSSATGLPIHLFFHGGGWWLGSIDERVVDATCRERCNGANCVVVSVDYRLAPEQPFPTAVEDCYSALLWSVEHSADLDGDDSNVSVGGVSAGANLAAAVALASRDRGGPNLQLQLLEVPPLDLTLSYVMDSDVPDSYGISRANLTENAELYLRHPEEARAPLASPLLATDFTDLPEASILTAQFDPLCVDGAAYAEKLRQAGVSVTYRCYEGAIHGSMSLTRVWEPARQWRAHVLEELNRVHWAIVGADGR